MGDRFATVPLGLLEGLSSLASTSFTGLPLMSQAQGATSGKVALACYPQCYSITYLPTVTRSYQCGQHYPQKPTYRDAYLEPT